MDLLLGVGEGHRQFPVVTFVLILLNVEVFLYELTLSSDGLTRLFRDRGLVPSRLVDWTGSPTFSSEPTTLITHAFIHAGWGHLVGNMVVLFLFGWNLEHLLHSSLQWVGDLLYVSLYVVSAVAGAALQTVIQPGETVPVVGASGAVSGVVGAYFITHRRNALTVFSIYFASQLVGALASLSADSGVAYWAHVGGFMAGVVAVTLAVGGVVVYVRVKTGQYPWQLPPAGNHQSSEGQEW